MELLAGGRGKEPEALPSPVHTVCTLHPFPKPGPAPVSGAGADPEECTGAERPGRGRARPLDPRVAAASLLPAYCIMGSAAPAAGSLRTRYLVYFQYRGTDFK